MDRGDYFETPPDVFKALDDEFHFDLDACATKENAKCAQYFSESEDALTVARWSDHGNRIFVNPPYSKAGRKDEFIRKAYDAMCNGSTVVMLLPAKVNTKAFHQYIWDKNEHRPYTGVQVRFPKGRIKFWLNGKVSEMHGQNECMIVVFKGTP